MAENKKVSPEKTPDSKAKVTKAAAVEHQRSGFDWASLNSLSAVSFASALSGVGSLVAVITGHIALAQLKTSGQSGRKLALIGVVLGYVQLAVIFLLSSLAVVAQVALFNMIGSEPGMWMNFTEMFNEMRFDWG
jgi:formate hydrogenlyase subunit 3/multisubunit Na+/H+ antiporter MnhD subunit